MRKAQELKDYIETVERLGNENKDLATRLSLLQRRVTWFLSFTEGMLAPINFQAILAEIGREVPKEHCTVHDLVFQGECPDCAHNEMVHEDHPFERLSQQSSIMHGEAPQ